MQDLERWSIAGALALASICLFLPAFYALTGSRRPAAGYILAPFIGLAVLATALSLPSPHAAPPPACPKAGAARGHDLTICPAPPPRAEEPPFAWQALEWPGRVFVGLVLIGVSLGGLILGHRWLDTPAKIVVAGVGALGLAALAKEMTLIKDLTLIKAEKADSLVRMQFAGGGEAPSVTAVAGPLDVECRPEWQVGDFTTGWSHHLGEAWLKGGAPGEGDDIDPRFAREAARVANSIADYRPNPAVMLIGSTDPRQFRLAPRYNADLAASRARALRDQMTPSLKARGHPGQAAQMFVLNDLVSGGVARPLIGLAEKDAGRSVIACGVWQADPVVSVKPADHAASGLPDAHFNEGGLAGFVLGVVLAWFALLPALFLHRGKDKDDHNGTQEEEGEGERNEVSEDDPDGTTEAGASSA
jgi:hypothetical protein